MYKNEFAVFDDLQNGKELVYLDSAASALKPKAVIEEMAEFASKHYSNVHRGAYYLSEMATGSFEQARKTIASFINTTDKNIIFTRGATDSINLVTGTSEKHLKPVMKLFYLLPNITLTLFRGKFYGRKKALSLNGLM